jgi:hypothetical protein
MRSTRLLGLVTFLVLCPGSTGWASPIAPGHVLVSANNYLGGFIQEYSPSGSLVQSISVPYPGGARPATETVRDMSVTGEGRVAVFNGTFSPYLSIYDPGNGS